MFGCSGVSDVCRCSGLPAGGAVGQEQRGVAPQDLLPAAHQGLGGPGCTPVRRGPSFLLGVSVGPAHSG